MDAFFAAIEQRDNPKLRGRPIFVGGHPGRRGVVSTCSYEARRFGVRSAMASAQAIKLCPHILYVPCRMHRYQEVSEEIFSIFHKFTDLVEPLSVDEAFLDVTENKIDCPSATILAKKIRQQIFQQTQLTASAGVSYNLFLAKVASGLVKPNGLTVIPPSQAEEFLDKLPIEKFFGVGKVTAKRFHDIGVRTGSDLKRLSLNELTLRFGKMGEYYYSIVRGIDDRPVVLDRQRKSLGKETTFPSDTCNYEYLERVLYEIVRQVFRELQETKLKGRTITLKLRWDNFQRLTRSITLSHFLKNERELWEISRLLLHQKVDMDNHKIRLLGVTVSHLLPKSELVDKNSWIQSEFGFVSEFSREN